MLQMEYSSYAVTIVKFVNEAENEKKNKIAEAKDYDFIGKASVLQTVLSTM